MTPQEQQLLMQLTQRINQTQLQEKDDDAQNLLGRELGANPDALYIMAQTLLVQNMALEQLKSQTAQLRQQLQTARQQPAHATSFLGRLFGEHDAPQPAPPQPAAPQPLRPQQTYAPSQPYPQQPPQAGWQPVPQYPQAPQYAPPQYAPPQYPAAPAGQPSFLRGAMQTAAGVAAGALVFEGVESLLHGFGPMGGGWGPGMAGFGMGPGMGFGGGFQRPVEETVVNNYYDQPSPMGSGDHRVEHDFGSAPDLQGGERHFQNTDGSGAVYSDANYTGPDTSGQDFSTANSDAASATGAFDQADNGQGLDTTLDNSADNVQIDDSASGLDDGSSFDSANFDDSGSFDDGGLDDNSGFDNSGGDGF